MRSITVKLILSFLVIGLISIAIIVLLARQNTQTEFNRFVTDRRGEDLVTELANYYQTNGSWNGANEVFAPDANHAEDGAKPYPSFTIADENGLALFDGGGYHTGDLIPDHELEFSTPISVDEKIVGILVMDRTPFPGNPREEEFIQRINLLLIYSGLGASLVALLLGILLSRTISRPIRELTLATHAVSEGDLSQQVPVRSKDEIGELSRAFNKMSAELSRSVNARKQMTADIAHELRTPLSLILGHAEAVHDGVLPPSPENFEIIREEAARLEHLVDDLRTLSLADAGELTLTPQSDFPRTTSARSGDSLSLPDADERPDSRPGHRPASRGPRSGSRTNDASPHEHPRQRPAPHPRGRTRRPSPHAGLRAGSRFSCVTLVPASPPKT